MSACLWSRVALELVMVAIFSSARDYGTTMSMDILASCERAAVFMRMRQTTRSH
jgi:hypothetical protein